MQLSGNEFDNIAAVVAAVVALSLSLATALGPSIMLLVEAVKSYRGVKDGSSGVVAVIIAVIVCGALGAITGAMAADDTQWANVALYTGIGAFVGLFVGAGAIQAHKAAGTINVETSTAVMAQKNLEAEEQQNGYQSIAYGLSSTLGQPTSSYRHEWRTSGDAEFLPDTGRTDDVPESDDSEELDGIEAAIQQGPSNVETASTPV